MCTEPTKWERCVEFHGHECAGLLIGYRAADIALKELGCGRANGQELVAMVEKINCSADAIQVLCGCTFGKKNLIFKDTGKQVFTVGSRRIGESVRISIKPDIIPFDSEYKDLMTKAIERKATLEERKLLSEKNHNLYHLVMEMPIEDFCTLETIPFDFPTNNGN